MSTDALNAIKLAVENRSPDFMQPDYPDYTGDDGLLYCGMCGTAKQVYLPPPFDCKMPCMCKCENERYEAANSEKQRREKLYSVEKNRQDAFRGTTMAGCTFEFDDGKNLKLTKLAQNYAQKFNADSCWLILYGECGTGKSYAAAAIVNALLEKGHTARFTSLSIIERELWDADSKAEVYGNLSRCDLLVLDDLGVQRNTEYMNEILFNVLDDRLRSGKPMIVTTNLTPADILQPKDMAMQRIMSRLCEKSAPFKCEGKDRRKDAMSLNAAKMIGELLADE